MKKLNFKAILILVGISISSYGVCTKQEIIKLIDKGFNKKEISSICGLASKNSKIKTWQKTYGGKYDDGASAIAKTDDGGFIIAGWTNSFGNGGDDVYLIKIDKNGNKIWQKTFGGKREDTPSAIAKTDDGGFIITGWTNSFGNGGWDVYLIKIDKNGNRIWQKTFGGKRKDIAKAIVKTDDGGFIIAGWTNSFGNGGWDVYLIKIDKNGNRIWQKTFGGKSEDIAKAIAKTDDGGFIIAGETNSFGNGGDDVYLIKIDKNGNKIWQKTFGGKREDTPSAIAKTDDGGFIIAGWTNSFGNGSDDVYLIKIDKDGNIIWQKTYGGKDWDILDRAYAIAKTDNEGFIIVGDTTESFIVGDVYLIKIDKDGNRIWQKTFGGKYDDEAYAIVKTDDGGFIIAGYTESFGNGGRDVYLIKIDKDGNSSPF